MILWKFANTQKLLKGQMSLYLGTNSVGIACCSRKNEYSIDEVIFGGNQNKQLKFKITNRYCLKTEKSYKYYALIVKFEQFHIFNI